MKETLVILAAGMGSRYGGLKQIDGVGNHNEPIIEFTIYDAIKSGFKKIILIIRKEHEEAFEEAIVKKIRPFVEVEYAYQNLSDLPLGIEVPEERVKPWGTAHAILSCKDLIKNDPFVVCNADDFYGRNAFEKIIQFFHNDISEDEYCMVAYQIEKTLSDNGSVTRGYCQKDENGYLSSIKELMSIRWNDNHDGVIYEENGDVHDLQMGAPVSMNFWGFTPSVFNKLSDLFQKEITQGIKDNPLKYEALLPSYIGKLISQNKCKVKVLTSQDSWFGVTYKQDKPLVVSKIQELKDQNIYPDRLFADDENTY